MHTTTASAVDILGEVTQSLDGIFERMAWAEDEIRQAQARHPQQADTLYHSFSLLSGAEGSERMSVEPVYRAHARELLERVAIGEDTRPGTAVEVIIGLLATATVAPLSPEGFALCARLWILAGLPDHEEFGDKLPHLEALHADRTNREEAEARRACRSDDRKLGAITCEGTHHGDTVTCTYASPTQ